MSSTPSDCRPKSRCGCGFTVTVRGQSFGFTNCARNLPLNAIMGHEVAMLLMLELPERGCWQVTGNYKSDHLSWVTWVD